MRAAASEAKARFRLLQEDETAIEAEMKIPLDWEELPEKKEGHVFLQIGETVPTPGIPHNGRNCRPG